MAGQLSKEELQSVLTEAMLAQKCIGPQRDRLRQLRRRLQQELNPSDDNIAAGLRELALDAEHIDPSFAAGLYELAVKRMDCAVAIKHVDLAPDIGKVYLVGIRPGARSIATCLDLAARSGARLALDPALAAMTDEQLYDALVTQAQRLPPLPPTQTEAFSRVEAAFHAVKLPRVHYLRRCIKNLTGIRPPSVTGQPSDDSSSEDEDEPLQAAANRSVDVDTARDYLDRACTLASLAVEHIDLAVAAFSSFLDPKDVASISDFTDRVAYDTSLRTDLITQI